MAKAKEPVNLFEQPKLKVKRLDRKAELPIYATPGAACFDICTISTTPLLSGHQRVYDTGLAVEVPTGYVLLIYSRSGMGFNKGVRLANAVGVLDSDYRGELKVCLRNDGKEIANIRAGDRIAQGMLVKIDQWAIEEVEELSDTQRGAGGMGSTGV